MSKFKEKLVAKLKANGLDAAEETAKAVVEAVFDSGSECIQEDDSTLNDILLPVIAGAKAAVLKQVDKIDGQEG